MERNDNQMHEIRRRFVRGLILKMQPRDLRAYVMGGEFDAGQDVVRMRKAA